MLEAAGLIFVLAFGAMLLLIAIIVWAAENWQGVLVFAIACWILYVNTIGAT